MNGVLDSVGTPGQIVGFRPEHVHLGGSDGLRFRARVEVVEYLGDELLAHLRVGDAALVAKLPVGAGVAAGEEREFSVPWPEIRLFDAKSERALGTAGALTDSAPALAA